MLMVGAGVCWSASSGSAQSFPPRLIASHHMISTMGRGLLPWRVCLMMCSGSWGFLGMVRGGGGCPIRWGGW